MFSLSDLLPLEIDIVQSMTSPRPEKCRELQHLQSSFFGQVSGRDIYRHETIEMDPKLDSRYRQKTGV